MKKFLFTLAALMMAGSAFATNDYCYIEDFYVTADQLGQEIDVPLKAHIEGILNAWDVTINYPEGITGVWAEDGEDMAFTYFNARGVEKTGAGTWAWNEDEGFTHGVAITGATIKSYQNVDGEWVYSGAPKWEPGEYEEVAILTILIDPSFDITKPVKFNIVSIPACGEDVRPNHSTGETATYEVTVNPEDTPTPEAFQASGTITFAGNVATLQYTSNDADAVVTVTVGGTAVNVTFVDGKAEVVIPETATEPGTYTVPVVMTIAPGADGSHVGEAVPVQENYTYTVDPIIEDLTATITIGDADGLFVPITVTNVNDAAAEIVVTVGDVVYPIENGGITLPEYDTDYNVVVTVTAKGEGYQGVVTEDKDVHTGVKPADPDAAVPVITFTPNEDGGLVKIENYTEYTITVNGELVDSRALPYQVNKGWEPKTIVVYAKNAPAGYTPKEDTKTFTLDALENLPSDEAEFGTPTTNAESMIIPVIGNVQSITVDGEAYTLDANNNLVLPRQDVDWTPEIVIVTNDGEHHNDATVTINDFTVPAILTIPAIDIVPGKAGGEIWHDPVQDPNTGVWTPGWTEYTVDGHYVDVTFSTNVENATLYWQILNEDGTVYLEGNTTDPTKVVTISEDGKYTAVAWIVTATDESKHNKKDFEINEMTSVNELVNGKTVANVRYFNVAGQEMQEANGMTIVVTTYTDGTTSTVKVMK